MKLVKKILLISSFLFSFIGVIAAIDEYADGYDEITAMVIHTWRVQEKRSPQYKYTIVWNDLEGRSHQGGSFANNYGYEEGDEIVIKVDKKTHEHLYAPISHLVLSIILLVIAMLLLYTQCKKSMGYRKKNR